MAGVTILQQPATTNAAYSKLLYVASSSRRDNPQFKFVADLYISGSDSRVGRFKTVPNPENVGVFDFSVPMQDQLSYDKNWKTIPVSESLEYGKPFLVKFGEEYGTSTSSSVTVYNGFEFAYAEGDPGVESNVSFVFKGINDPLVNNSYDFDTSVFDTGSFTSENLQDSTAGYANLRGPRLSNYPSGYEASITYPKPISSNDWETISFLKNNDSGYNYSGSSVQVFQSGSSSGVTQTIYTNITSTQQNILTLGVGPQNFISSSDASISNLFTGSWSHYEVFNIYNNGGTKVSSSYWYVNDDFCSLEQPLTTALAYSTGTWTTKNNTPKFFGWTQGAGTVSSAWSAGGHSGSLYTPPPTPETKLDVFFLWNGTNWSTGTAMPSVLIYCANVGTQTSAYVMGGVSGLYPISSTVYYNGVSWSAGSNMNSARSQSAAAGDYTKARVAGPGSTSEVWDGISWSTGPSLVTSWQDGPSTGGTSDSFVMSTRPTGGGNQEFNGTVFATIAANNNGSGYKAGAGISRNAVLVFGGEQPSGISLDDTEVWNGNNWKTLASLNQSRYWNAGAGTNTDALTWGGYAFDDLPQPYTTNTTEQFSTTTNEVIIDPALTFLNDPNKGNYDTTRFAFINQYGAWDYYSISTPIKKQTKLSRENVIVSQVNYSALSPSYDVSRRTNTQYYNALEDSIEITTEYIDQDTSNWLTELFESPSVFEQIYVEETDSYDFVPVVIDNKRYTWNTDSRQHVFQYTIQYRRGNQRRSRI